MQKPGKRREVWETDEPEQGVLAPSVPLETEEKEPEPVAPEVIEVEKTDYSGVVYDVQIGIAGRGMNIYQRMVALESEISRVVKDAQVSREAGGWKYPSHDAVTAALHPLFVRWGIYAHPTVEEWGIKPYRLKVGKGQNSRMVEVDVTWMMVKVVFVNIDSPEDKLSTQAVGYGFGEKAPGIAYSYGAKGCYLKASKLESGEKDLEDETDPANGWGYPPDDPGPPEPAAPAPRREENGDRPVYLQRTAVKDGPPDCQICAGKIFKGQNIVLKEGTGLVAHETCFGGGDPPPVPKRRAF